MSSSGDYITGSGVIPFNQQHAIWYIEVTSYFWLPNPVEMDKGCEAGGIAGAEVAGTFDSVHPELPGAREAWFATNKPGP